MNVCETMLDGVNYSLPTTRGLNGYFKTWIGTAKAYVFAYALVAAELHIPFQILTLTYCSYFV